MNLAVERGRRNQRLALKLALVALFFTAFGFALVPLYDVFCKVTGLNGKTNAQAIAPEAANTQLDATRWVRVEFLGHTMPGVGLQFKPETFEMRLHPGAITRINYEVTNRSGRVFVGQAVPSITPSAGAQYFEKLECFCFHQQTFQPGETRTMPVVFVVNPAMSPDIHTLTLSYTFFEAVKAQG